MSNTDLYNQELLELEQKNQALKEGLDRIKFKLKKDHVLESIRIKQALFEISEIEIKLNPNKAS